MPSGDPRRDEQHPLRRIVGELVGPTRGRHERLLRRSAREVAPRVFDSGKFEAARALRGENVLLVDDTWTTGASAQSAAAALKSAGSGAIGCVVIGRYVTRQWHGNDRRLRTLTRPFDWEHCPLCAQEGAAGEARD